MSTITTTQPQFDKYQAYSFRWARLEGEPNVQHCFRPCDQDVNVSLCEEFVATGDDGIPITVNKITAEKKQVSIACPDCLKVFKEILKK